MPSTMYLGSISTIKKQSDRDFNTCRIKITTLALFVSIRDSPRIHLFGFDLCDFPEDRRD